MATCLQHCQAAYTMLMLQPSSSIILDMSSLQALVPVCFQLALLLLLLRPCPAAAALPCCCGPALLPANCPSLLCQRLQSSEPLPALFFVLDRSPTWSFENQKDVRKRPPGPVQNPQKDAVSDPQGFLGISKAFGFTKRNEASRQC